MLLPDRCSSEIWVDIWRWAAGRRQIYYCFRPNIILRVGVARGQWCAGGRRMLLAMGFVSPRWVERSLVESDLGAPGVVGACLGEDAREFTAEVDIDGPLQVYGVCDPRVLAVALSLLCLTVRLSTSALGERGRGCVAAGACIIVGEAWAIMVCRSWSSSCCIRFL